MVESNLQAQCLKFLREKVGGYWIDIVVSTYQSKGEPDIVGCYQGRFYAFETKFKKYEATDIQKEKIQRINLAGGVAMEIRSLNELKKVFNL